VGKRYACSSLTSIGCGLGLDAPKIEEGNAFPATALSTRMESMGAATVDRFSGTVGFKSEVYTVPLPDVSDFEWEGRTR